MISFAGLNIVAVFVTALAAMAIGFIWYSPGVFGTKWMKYSGISKESAGADMNKAMATGFVATLINVTFLSILLQIVGTSSLKEAATLATVLWAATVLPGELHGIAWEKRPVQLLYINASNALVTYVVVAVILQWWPA